MGCCIRPERKGGQEKNVENFMKEAVESTLIDSEGKLWYGIGVREGVVARSARGKSTC